ncbi:electron transfer flavoprotein-ubiquinone oxidoreductase [Pluralibacter gergoviae]|uniref:electron transfer flavoprotein-ubiquinone oxidoreductase n=1 Tax=Pluralibacter gergoviae TaxID=61647 RepID=UPI0006501138|nr:electron transfer flavoprotein-ubiquinone oxidoreductase [Pluralibacter gergoviae]KMK33605.1 electron transfer flavoprotein-ubiquinone oxidoreductase [Pluralibacter gergoviae]
MNEKHPQAQPPRETMACDVLIVGAGPAGLAAAIRLKSLANEAGADLSVMVIDKGSEPGAHILSGAVMDPRALDELIPDWRARGAPLTQAVMQDEVLFLTRDRAMRTPDLLVPDNLRNHGNYIISLGNLVKWLAGQAEAAGVDIFPGFPATDVLYDDSGSVVGIATGDMGLHRDGTPKENFERGIEIRARYTLFAEGARGQLGKALIARFHLDDGKAPQSFSLGIKELWEVPAACSQPGLVIHTAGWPMDKETFGGGFLYHLNDNKVALGLVVGLDYPNPTLSPYQEMQRWKTHPAIRRHIAQGKRLGYGARAINNGGIPSMPTPCFPGGLLIGCNSGTLNASRIKGSHAAMKSGELAAEAVFEALQSGRQHDSLSAYQTRLQESWLWQELEQGSNFKPWFKKGRAVGMMMTGVEHWLLPRLGVKKAPWRVKNSVADHLTLRPADRCSAKIYDKPDGKITFDLPSSVYLSNTWHDEDEPVHLRLSDSAIPVAVNLETYAGPEARYCPAGVYEYVNEGDAPRLQINAQNCVHCKTCDIKDPRQNITWTAPQGGEGPNYTGM